MDNIKARKESLSDWRSQFEIKSEGYSLRNPDKNWYKDPDGVSSTTGEKSSERNRQNVKKGNLPDKALRAYRNVRKVVDTFTGNKAGAYNRATNPQGLERLATGLTDTLTGDKTDYDRRGKKVKEEVEGGVSVENYADGVQFNEIETVDIIKPEPLNPSNWRSNLEVVDETAKVMLKVGKRVWKTPGVRKFSSQVPSNLSKATKINPLTKSQALTKQTNSFSVKPLERGSKAGEVFGPGRGSLNLRSDIGRSRPKNMAVNQKTGDYVPKLEKSNYELVPGAKYGDKVMAKNYKLEREKKEAFARIDKQLAKERAARGYKPDGITPLSKPKGIKDKSDINQAALKTLKKESYSWRNDLNVLDEKKIPKPAIKALKNTAKTGATVGATTGVLKAIDRATDTTDAALNIMTSTFAAGNNQRSKAQSEDERLTKRRIQIANNAVGYTPYVTTSESNVSEGNRTNYKGIGVSGSGNKKDMSKGPNEPAPVDYRWIQAKNPKKKPSSKKNPGLGDFKPSDKIYAGYEPEGKIVENAAVKALVKGKNLNKLRKGLLQSTGLASGIANMMSKSGIPDDINKEAPADIKKELDKPQVVKDRSHGKKLLDDLIGNPMKDKYNKDALDNEKTDSILDPAGDQKKKPSLEQLKKAAKKRRKKVEESNWREEIELG